MRLSQPIPPCCCCAAHKWPLGRTCSVEQNQVVDDLRLGAEDQEGRKKAADRRYGYATTSDWYERSRPAVGPWNCSLAGPSIARKCSSTPATTSKRLCVDAERSRGRAEGPGRAGPSPPEKGGGMSASVIVQAEPLGVGARDAAAMIGISVRSLRRGVEGGRIPRPLKVGNRSIWSSETLRQWFAGGCKAVGTPAKAGGT